METVIEYTSAKNSLDLEKILQLQWSNLEKNLEPKELAVEGFVTANHSLELLIEMNNEGPHIIAKAGNDIIGYALVMTQSFQFRLPVLVPMFDEIKATRYGNKLLGDYKYFVMGQICIGKPYRGTGVFQGLYLEMRNQFKDNYDLVVTEIALRNPRSIRAHQKVGFQIIHQYRSNHDHEDWVLVVWDWRYS